MKEVGVYDYHRERKQAEGFAVPFAEHVQETEQISPNKAYVEVIASFSADGKMLPLKLIWENGKSYEIDRILRVARCASLRAERAYAMSVEYRGREWSCITKRTGSGLCSGR